ncbi:hypothetical protein [Streptomyces sp. NPDC001833]|uniref:hypothetical protein n=1 Tax=Streptomyces sp. NPDC001833 TaxID=3154658 RepID=UPI0033253C69
MPVLDFAGTPQERRASIPSERIGSPPLLGRRPGSDQADLRAALQLREAVIRVLIRSSCAARPRPVAGHAGGSAEASRHRTDPLRSP